MPEKLSQLSRREREIMDIIYARGELSAAEVREAMDDAPSDSAIRTHLRILEEKGNLKHREDGLRYIYSPVHSRGKASRSVLRKVLDTFFEGSLAKAVASMVDGRDGALDAAEIARLEEVLRSAKPKKSSR
jgi:BlaI family penicillinase repressor